MGKRLGKITAIVCAAFLAVALAGCASVSSEDAIRQSVSQELDIYKNMDEKAIGMVVASAEEEGLTELGIDGRKFATAVLGGFDYTINSVAIDGNSAVANVTIVSRSMSEFETKFNDAVNALVTTPTAGRTARASNDDIERRIGEMAMDAIEKTSIIEENVDLTFNLEKSTWVSTNVADVLGSLDSIVFAN